LNQPFKRKRNKVPNTQFSIRTEILADLWMNYRGDEEFTDFIEYNDLGLPMSYSVVNLLAKITPAGEKLVNETFELLIASLEITEDTGFESLDDLLGLSE
jgi:hypothetical protein